MCVQYFYCYQPAKQEDDCSYCLEKVELEIFLKKLLLFKYLNYLTSANKGLLFLLF